MKAILQTVTLVVCLFAGGAVMVQFMPQPAYAQALKPGGGGSFSGTAPSFTSSASSGSNGFIASTGVYYCMNGSGCTSAVYGLNGNLYFQATSAGILSLDGGSGLGKFAFDVEVSRGLRLGTGGVSKPTCSVTERGKIYFTQSANGVKDALEVCAKDSADAYAWRVLY